MSEQIESNDKQYPEHEAEIRLTLKVKQHSDGSVSGYVYNFEVNNYEGLIPNVTEMTRVYDFQFASDSLIKTTVNHILKNRA